VRASRPHLPGYGIVSADEGEGLLPFEWAEARLRATRNYWVATRDPDGQPAVAAVWGVWLDRQVVFSTGRRSRKARNLEADPRCAVTTESAGESVVVEGRARQVGFTDAFVTAYGDKYDFDITTLDEPIFAIAPLKVIAIIETEDRFAATATRWIFDD
jgi:hypothetical protein